MLFLSRVKMVLTRPWLPKGESKHEKMYTVGFLGLILFLCVGMNVASNGAAEIRFSEQVKAIASLTEQEKLDAIGWHVRAKGTEKQYEGTFSELISEFESDYPSFKRISAQADEHYLRAVFTNASTDGLREEIKFFASPMEDGVVFEQSYELIADDAGTVFNFDTFEERLTEFDLGDAELFYQVTAETDHLDEVSLYEQAKDYADELGAIEQEVLNEGTFVSLSAYNEEWSGGIALNDERTMNVQVALRQNQTWAHEQR